MSKLVKKTEEETALGFLAELGQTTDDVATDDRLPQIKLLQISSSAQLDDESSSYIPGAEPSMFFNSNTQELYNKDGKGFGALLIDQDHFFGEWSGDKSDGSGKLENRYEVTDNVVRSALRANKGSAIGLKHPNGNELTDTYNLTVLLINDDYSAYEVDGKPVVAWISVSKTSISPLTQFNKDIKKRAPGMPQCLIPLRITSKRYKPWDGSTPKNKSFVIDYQPLAGGEFKDCAMLKGNEPVFEIVKEVVKEINFAKNAKPVEEDVVPF